MRIIPLILLLSGLLALPWTTMGEVSASEEKESISLKIDLDPQSLLPRGEQLEKKFRYAEAAMFFLTMATIEGEETDSAKQNRVAALGKAGINFALAGYPREAQVYLGQALTQSQKIYGPQHPTTAHHMMQMATVYRQTGSLSSALLLARLAVSIHEKVFGANHLTTGESLLCVVQILRDGNKWDEAMTLGKKVLAIRQQELGEEDRATAEALHVLATLYNRMNQGGEAEKHARQALVIREKILGPDHPDIANSLQFLAGLASQEGAYGQAIQLGKRALAILEQTLGAQHIETAYVLNNLSHSYQMLGETSQALPLLERSVAIKEMVTEETMTLANSLNNLANLYLKLGKNAKALTMARQALAMGEKVAGKDHPSVAMMLGQLGEIHRRNGDHKQAFDHFQRALALRETLAGKEHPDTIKSSIELANYHNTQKEYEQALGYWVRAWHAVSRSSQPDLLWRIHAGFMETLSGQDHYDAAILFGKEAIQTLQGMREKIKDMKAESQNSFIKGKKVIYQKLAHLLMMQQRYQEAEEVLSLISHQQIKAYMPRERSKEEGKLTWREAEKSMVEQQESLTHKALVMGSALSALRKKGDPSQEEREQIGELEKEMETVHKAFEQQVQRLRDSLPGALAQVTPELAAGRAGQLGEVVRRLGHGAVVLFYFMTEQNLHILMVASDARVGRSVAMERSQLEEKIQAFNRALRERDGHVLAHAQGLYDVLLAPIAKDLLRLQAKTLMISLTGSLRHLPFAALHDGEKYWVERYPTVVYTATDGASSSLEQPPKSDWQVVGMGVSKALAGFPALNEVPEELQGIIRQEEQGRGILPGRILLNEDFTLENFNRLVRERNFSVLHLASHFQWREDSIGDSFLLLGDGHRLSLQELGRSDLTFADVDLITLSACDTGRGGNGVKLEGLAAMMQDKGARGVMATLWPVADKSTSRLMRTFYELRQQEGLTKAEALARAQRILLHERVEPTPPVANRLLRTDRPTTGGDSPYAHPYYWAPFVLMGNWL